MPFSHKHVLERLLLLAGFWMLAAMGIAQQTKLLAPHDPIAPLAKRHYALTPVPGSDAGGPWIVDPNFDSTIYLKNVVETAPVTITPVLHVSDGTEYRLPAVQLAPSGTASIDIGSELLSKGIGTNAALSGWVELQYDWPWAPVCAIVRVVDFTHSLSFAFGFQTPQTLTQVKQPPASSQVIEGLWWKQESTVTGFLTLANTTSNPISALVAISDNQASVLGTHTVTVPAQGMTTIDLQELQQAPTQEGGIRVSYVGVPDALLVNGGLEDKNVGYSANLPFEIPLPPLPPKAHWLAQHGIAEVGVMDGPADPLLHFPSGTVFIPYSVLRNVSNQPISVTPTVWWMYGMGGMGGSIGSFKLPTFQLLPYETRALDMSALLASVGLKSYSGAINLVFDTQGQNGLLIAGGSVDQTGNYVFEVSPRTITPSAGKSLSYWSTANGDNTMVTLWNPADEPQDFIFRLVYAGGHYNMPVHLGPK